MVKNCHMMIFGSTGDLTYQKLLPAIFDLYKANELCDQFQLVCIGRRAYTLEEYLASLDASIQKQIEFHDFKKHIIYHQMDFTNSKTYETLKQFGMDNNWVFYLATAPRFFQLIAEFLHDSHFLDQTTGFKRIVFEKPFGENFQDAKKINEAISRILNEDQIYRIDHYLGKEMIQNILLTRMYNNVIEMLWHKDAIESIEVVISEKDGVKNRGGYYDQSGALKDMVQNHIFQIVALLAMDLPESLDPASIRNEKNKILKKIKLTEDYAFGQYKGYLQEKGIPETSKTETFVALKLHVDSDRWEEVPFYIKTGKSLAIKHAHVVVRFKENKGHVNENVLMIEIQPEEGIYLQMNSKMPGISTEVTRVTMNYCHSCLKYGAEPSAYSRLLLDTMIGDKSLFASWEEIETSWEIIDQVEKIKQNQDLIIYDPGTMWDRNILVEKGWWLDD